MNEYWTFGAGRFWAKCFGALQLNATLANCCSWVGIIHLKQNYWRKSRKNLKRPFRKKNCMNSAGDQKAAFAAKKKKKQKIIDDRPRNNHHTLESLLSCGWHGWSECFWMSLGMSKYFECLYIFNFFANIRLGSFKRPSMHFSVGAHNLKFNWDPGCLRLPGCLRAICQTLFYRQSPTFAHAEFFFKRRLFPESSSSSSSCSVNSKTLTYI